MSSSCAPHAVRESGEASGACMAECLLLNNTEQGAPVKDVPASAAVFASETLFSVITLLRALAVGVCGLVGVRNMLSLSVSVVAGQLSAQTCAAINSALVSLDDCGCGPCLRAIHCCSRACTTWHHAESSSAPA